MCACYQARTLNPAHHLLRLSPHNLGKHLDPRSYLRPRFQEDQTLQQRLTCRTVLTETLLLPVVYRQHCHTLR